MYGGMCVACVLRVCCMAMHACARMGLLLGAYSMMDACLIHAVWCISHVHACMPYVCLVACMLPVCCMQCRMHVACMLPVWCMYIACMLPTCRMHVALRSGAFRPEPEAYCRTKPLRTVRTHARSRPCTHARTHFVLLPATAICLRAWVFQR